MNSTEAIRSDVARLVFEYEINALDEVIHGVTFDGRRLVLAAGYRIARLMPDGGRVVDQLETFPERGGLAYDGRHLWQHSEGNLQQLDPRTGFVLRSISPRLGEITGLECIGNDVLVLHQAGAALARVETLNATSIADFDLPTPLQGLARIGRELWSSTGSELCRLDPGSGKILGRVGLPSGIAACDLAGDAENRVWCVDGKSRRLRAFARLRAG